MQNCRNLSLNQRNSETGINHPAPPSRLTHSIVRLQGVSESTGLLCTAAWLYNPFTFSIGTRGNCEALVSAMLLGMLYCLLKGRLLSGALW
jgi:hypothetical protein